MKPHERIPLHHHTNLNDGGQLIISSVQGLSASLTGQSAGGSGDHELRHAKGGGDALPVESLGTSATTTTNVLKPDGSGGVAFGALPGATPSGGYGTAAAGSAATAIRSDAVLPKPTAADVDFSADVTTNNATTGHHGLLPKLDNTSTHFLNGTGGWTAPAGSGISSGTSNPGSPSTNDLFFRTDLRLLIVYDGTRWVTTDLYHDPVGLGDVAPFPTTSTNAIGRMAMWASDYSLWIEAFYSWTFVTTTNNGSNYWTVSLQDHGGGSTLGSFNTSADTASTFTSHKVTIGASTSDYGLRVSPTKTAGAPGSLYVPSAVSYRLIVT